MAKMILLWINFCALWKLYYDYDDARNDASKMLEIYIWGQQISRTYGSFPVPPFQI